MDNSCRANSMLCYPPVSASNRLPYCRQRQVRRDGALQKTLHGLEREECAVRVSLDEGTLRIRHRHKAKKGLGILPTLSRALGEPPLAEKLEVHREQQLAVSAENDADPPVSFYEVFSPDL